MGIVKLTKSSLIDPQDTGLKPVANPPCLASETAVSLNLTIPAEEGLEAASAAHLPGVVRSMVCCHLCLDAQRTTRT